MHGHSKTAAVLAAILAVLTMALPGCAEETDAGWTPSEDARVFSGDDLFIYINGGAAIYHEYGFEEVRVSEYSCGGRTISVAGSSPSA